MRIFTEEKLNRLLEKIRVESYEKGFKDGKEEGVKIGLHEGYITDKQGMFINSNGLYHFVDGIQKEVIKNIE